VNVKGWTADFVYNVSNLKDAGAEVLTADTCSARLGAPPMSSSATAASFAKAI